MDVLGQLPTSRRGNRDILVITDILSRFHGRPNRIDGRASFRE
jgi:hypothetical protein